MADITSSAPKRNLWKYIAVMFVVLSIILAGAFTLESSGYSNLTSKYNRLQAAYTQAVSRYNELQNSTASKINLMNSSLNNYSLVAIAYSHWNAIASLNLTSTTSQYSSTPVLYWEGGALNGTYSGNASIASVWVDFFNSARAAWWSGISPLSQITLRDKAYVNETIQFTVTSASNQQDITSIIVSYSLMFTYSNGHWSISNEIWKLAGHRDLTVQAAYVLSVAYSHWNAIAIENASLLGSQYTSNATLHWIGGPLTGTYSGSASILNTWNRFFGLWNAVWFYSETTPSVIVNGGSAQVAATVQFPLVPAKNPTNVQALNISYVLDFAATSGGWEIYNETWHIIGQQDFVNESAYLLSLAFDHWNSIAIESLDLVMQQYNSVSVLQWVGGPLNGVYNGSANISAAWSRFFGLWSAVWFYAEATPVVSLTGNGGSVTALVQFVVNNTSASGNITKILTVNYSLDYTVNPVSSTYYISNEIFQVTASNF